MWKKVLYLGVTIIFGFLVYIMSSNSNQMNHLESLVTKAIESEKFHEVPMIWDGCFDTTSIVKNESDKMDIVLYPATSQTDITYGPEGNTSRFLKFEKAYYLYIFNTEFSLESVKTSSDTTHNYSGIEFSNGTNTFTYYFIVNDKINTSSYEAAPTTKEQTVLKGARDVTNTNSIWNFMRVTFTETMLNQIVKELGGEVTQLSVKDSEGKAQYTTDVKVDFSQKFFTDVKPLFDNYNVYLDSYLSADGDKNKINEAQTKFNEFYNPWYEEFESKKEETKYTFRFDNDILSPSKLMWQTTGIVALYIFVVALVYMLLFHFKSIKRIFSRENYKKYSSEDSKILVNGKWVDRSSAKMGKVSSEKVETVLEPDTKAEEALETVTATELITEATEEQAKDEILSPEIEDASVTEQPVLENAEEIKEEQPLNEEIKLEANADEKSEEITQQEAVVHKEKAPAKTIAKKSTSSKTSTSKKTASTKKATTSKTTKEKSDEAH